jgi:hypothetical protein
MCLSANSVVPGQAFSGRYVRTSNSGSGVPRTIGTVVGAAVEVVAAGAVVVVGATVVVGAVVVVVGATVVVGAVVVVVGATVVVGAVVVVVGATVVTGVAVSELPPHPETTNRNVRTTACFLTVSVCHPSPEGGAANCPSGDVWSQM